MTEETPHTSNADAATTQMACDFPSLRLQPEFHLADRDRFHLADLLQYHDRHFVENAYAAICRRAPTDAELSRTLNALRGGHCNKIEIIEDLLSAQPPSSRRVRIAGLPSPLMKRVSRLPVLGYLLRLMKGLARLPVLMQHQQQFEAYALAQQQRIVDHVNQSFEQIFGSPAGEYLSPASSLRTTITDALETVAMLSESLGEIPDKQAQFEAQLTAMSETIARERDAQQEFLQQEQKVIVETQKAVLADIQERLDELARQQQRASDELAAQTRRLQSLLEGSRRRAPSPD